MYGKIEISGNIELVTGMYIGGSSAFAAIGAVDSPVIKDVRSGLPMIPGSSLKGKMRTLLAKEYDKEYLAAKPDDDDERITRLFGSAKKDHVSTARLLFPDMILSNEEELRHSGIESITEVKFENTINRATAVANPRQIERAIRGSVFVMSLLYEVNSKTPVEEISEDFETIAEGMKLLTYDYLGGSGSRGYGKIKFNDVVAAAVVGDIDDSIIDDCNKALARVNS